MALDPQAQAMLHAFSDAMASDFNGLSITAYRAMVGASNGFAQGDPVASERDIVIPASGGPIPARVYRPLGEGPFPLTVFFHGGGFVACGLDTHANLCRCLAQRAQTVVLSVDYRLAPEARFPAAAHDACDAARWALANARQLGAVAGKIALAGDSAGGNLAAVCAQQLREYGEAIVHQLLLYPVLDCAAERPSYETLGSGYLLTAAMMRWFKDQYFSPGTDRADPLASPLSATDLSDVASATIISAEFDPLRDEAEQYAARLAQAGVLTTCVRWQGQMHGFASALGALDAADEVVGIAARALRHALHA